MNLKILSLGAGAIINFSINDGKGIGLKPDIMQFFLIPPGRA